MNVPGGESRHYYIGRQTGPFVHRFPFKKRKAARSRSRLLVDIADLIKKSRQIRLLQQKHLLYAREVAGGEMINIHAACKISGVKVYAMRAGGKVSVNQRRHYLSERVVDLQLNIRLLRN